MHVFGGVIARCGDAAGWGSEVRFGGGEYEPYEAK